MSNHQQSNSIETIESNYRQAMHGLFRRRLPEPPGRAMAHDPAVDRLLALAMDQGLHITVYEISPHRKSPAGAGWVSLGSRGK
jgi:hypothetical protein